MKTCAVCGTELPTPLDEFGDIRETLCRSCFLDGDVFAAEENEKTIKELMDEIEELENEYDSISSEIWNKKGELQKLKGAISTSARAGA